MPPVYRLATRSKILYPQHFALALLIRLQHEEDGALLWLANLIVQTTRTLAITGCSYFNPNVKRNDAESQFIP